MKKIKSKNINLNFTNIFTYISISFIILLLIGISVFAFGTSTPSTFGHSAGELDLSEGVQGDAIFLGNLDVAGRVKIGTSIICDIDEEGSLRYNSIDKKIEYCNSTDWKSIKDPEYEWVHIGTETKSMRYGVCYGSIKLTITCDAIWDGTYPHGDLPGTPQLTATAGPGNQLYLTVSDTTVGAGSAYRPKVLWGGYGMTLSDDNKVLISNRQDTCGPPEGYTNMLVDIYECQVK